VEYLFDLVASILVKPERKIDVIQILFRILLRKAKVRPSLLREIFIQEPYAQGYRMLLVYPINLS